MATSHPFETLVEGDVDVDVDEAVKQILVQMEAEEQDPLEGMGNVQIAEIYHRMKPEDQRLFRQFKQFHKRYYETHGHDAPSHQLTRGIVQQMFPGLPSADAETIAKARAELLAAERIKELCNHHDSCQDKRRRGRLNSRHRKRLRPSRTSSLGGWPPHI